MSQAMAQGELMAAAIAERASGSLAADRALGRTASGVFDTTIDLSQDAVNPGLPDHVFEAVDASLDAGETHYTDRPGLPALRQAAADKLAAEQNLHLNPGKEVVISCGEQEGVFLALQAWVKPGDEVLIPNPGPAYLAEAVRLSGGKAVPVLLSADNGFGLQATQVEQVITPRSRVLVLVNPADPTGAVISADEMARIAAVVKAHDLRVVSAEGMDEALAGDVLHGHAQHRSIASFADAPNRTLVVGSFSKLYGLASWRVGYFAGPQALVTPVRDLKQAMSICTSAMAQYAALAAMTGPADWLLARRAGLAAKRAGVVQALETMGLPHSQPQAGPFVFVDITSTGFTSAEFARWLLAEAQVSVSAGAQYGSQGEGFVRISVWATPSEVEQAMRRMAAIGPMAGAIERQRGRTA